MGLSLLWLLFCGAWAPGVKVWVIVACWLSCSAACGSFTDQRSNPCSVQAGRNLYPWPAKEALLIILKHTGVWEIKLCIPGRVQGWTSLPGWISWRMSVPLLSVKSFSGTQQPYCASLAYFEGNGKYLGHHRVQNCSKRGHGLTTNLVHEYSCWSCGQFWSLSSIQGALYKPLWEQEAGSGKKDIRKKMEVKMNWQAIGLKFLLNPDLASN